MRLFSHLFTLSFVCLSFFPNIGSAQNSYTAHTTVLREGPGSYYPMVIRLDKGVTVGKIEEDDRWIKIQFDTYSGWIPARMITETKPISEGLSTTKSDDPFAELEVGLGKDDQSSKAPYATPAQVAAAVKGFARKYRTRSNKDATVVDYTDSFDYRINQKDYNSFRRDRISRPQWYNRMKRYELEKIEVPVLSFEREKASWAIANTLAQSGLVSNYEVQEFLTYVALLIAESSHQYELPVQVHILDTDELSGYALPNGIIFVSKGILKSMKNEAELAFFLAHELAHINAQHGAAESILQKNRINASKNIEEMDAGLNETYELSDENLSKVDEELTALADELFEYTIKDRLEEYEYEADRFGLQYLLRAGYDASSVVPFLERMERSMGAYSTRKEGSKIWQGLPFPERISFIKKTLQSLTTRKTPPDTINEEEFMEKIWTLR